MSFVTREARLQDVKNRQNSIDVEDEELQDVWKNKQDHSAWYAKEAYNWAIQNGIAKEQARAVLPEGLTTTRLYMSGTLRSWIHFVDVRAEQGTQKEHRMVAESAREEILKHFPSLQDYWFPVEEEAKEAIKLLHETKSGFWWHGWRKK